MKAGSAQNRAYTLRPPCKSVEGFNASQLPTLFQKKARSEAWSKETRSGRRRGRSAPASRQGPRAPKYPLGALIGLGVLIVVGAVVIVSSGPFGLPSAAPAHTQATIPTVPVATGVETAIAARVGTLAAGVAATQPPPACCFLLADADLTNHHADAGALRHRPAIESLVRADTARRRASDQICRSGVSSLASWTETRSESGWMAARAFILCGMSV